MRVFPLLVIDQHSVPMLAEFLCPRAAMTALPIELLAVIVEYLPPTERWRAASVSRDFRTAAHIAGFPIHYRLKWSLGLPINDALAELSGLIVHIARDNLRISLDFACCPVHAVRPWEKSLEMFSEIISVLSSAMPYMSAFTAAIPEQLREAFNETVLNLPAPNLRSLSLTHSVTVNRFAPNMLPIPGFLFAGDAPYLRNVSLFYFPLPADPIKAFACVRTLHVVCNDGYPPMDLARHFPALTNLHTELSSGVHAPSVSRMDQAFARLSLDELTLDCARIMACDPKIGRVLAVRSTRVVRLQGSSIFWEESLLGLPSASLSARLRSLDVHTEMTVVPDSRAWRRIVVYGGHRQDDTYSAVAQCPSFRDALTYMRLDCSLIGDFLDAACDMPALRELRIDMCPSRGYKRIATLLPIAYPPLEPDFANDPDYDVPCPALRTLTVFALDVPTKIDPLEAAHLGRALGQVDRLKEERARIVLSGCVLTKNDSAHVLLDQAFSCVQLRPFAGRDSVEDRQCILWDV